MRTLLLLLPFALAACGALPVMQSEPDPTPMAAGEDACGASGYQSFVGQPLAAITLPDDLNVRVIEPDTAVTMDFQPDRLNLYVGEDGLIDQVSCG